MSFRYIGSKARVVEAILEHIGPPNGGTFVDAFSGTGAVAQAASLAGWPVHINDHLASSTIKSLARVLSSEQLQFEFLGGYRKAIETLNNIRPKKGFIWKEYSPASSEHCPVSRKYFTEENAQKIDAVRHKILNWKENNIISDIEEYILIADLIAATDKIANTAGTYGCFLSKWQRGSLSPLTMVPRNLPVSTPPVSISSVDVMELDCNSDDTVYLDPPYTKRQYAAYYHILETITFADEPKVEGVAGIRPWQDKASDFCYKAKAPDALDNLIQKLPAQRIFLSYSTEGHIQLDRLFEILKGSGDVTLYKLDQIGRYRPNPAASKASSHVGEVLFCIDKSVSKRQAVA